MTKEELQKSLQNISTVIIEGRILISGNALTGKEHSQLHRDIASIGDALRELENYRLQAEIDKADVGEPK